MNPQTESVKMLMELVTPNSGSGKYDVLVPVSGGKDGLWILSALSKVPGLRIAGLHVDNWFVSRAAQENIERAAQHIDFDLITIRPNWKVLKDAYRTFVMNLGEMCILCEGMISLYPIEVATSMRIPKVVWGLTPSQLAQKRILNGRDNVDSQKYNRIGKYYKQLIQSAYKEEPEGADPIVEKLFTCFLREDDVFPEYVFPFHFTGYDAETVENEVSKNIGWQRAADVGGTSSNCVINQFHIHLKKMIRGEDFYKDMVKAKLAAGEVIESVAESALNANVDQSVIDDVLQKLNIDLQIPDLITHINCFKKDICLQIESNISR